LILFLFIGINTFGQQESLIRISPIQLEWDGDAQLFHAYFDVTNDTPEDRDLTSIIIFKIGKYKRWRGSELPVIRAKQTGSFRISFSPGIMLKNEYVSISVNIYGKAYIGLLDYSSRYLQISTRRVMTAEETQIEITEEAPETVAAPARTKKRVIVLGPANKRMQLLATERFQNAVLEPVSPEEKRLLAEGKPSTPSKPVSGIPVVPPRKTPQLSFIAGDGKLLLSWTSVENAVEYHLYWGTSPDLEPSAGNRITLQGNQFEHTGLENNQTYYYQIAAVNADGEGALSLISTGIPKPPPVVEASVSELLEGVQLDEFQSIQTDPALLVTISDATLEKEASLKRAEELTTLDISSRDRLISLYIAEGKSESVAQALSGQLSKEPENLNLSLSLSKVYHEQGDIKAALKVLNSSLNRISLSARIALNQELKTSVRQGESTLTTKSEEAYLADEFSRLGISLLEKEKYVEALSAFQSLYSLSQDYPMVKYYLGLSRHGMKQYNQAKQLFVEQAQADLKKKQLLDDLAALTLVLATTLDMSTIKNTKDQYVQLQQEENTPEETQIITRQIVTLDGLMAEAEKRRLAGLSDLAIAVSGDFTRDDLQPGQSIRFAFIATNLGKKQSEPYKVFYQLKHDQGMIFDIPSFDRFQALNPDKSSTSWEKEIVIPEGVVPGKYQLIANIEQTSGKGEVTFENNRVQTELGISIIPPVPDLEIGFETRIASMPIQAQQKIDLDLGVRNKGFKDSPPFEVDYFLESRDGQKIDLQSPDKIAPVSKGNVKTTWKKQLSIPADISEGSYQVMARIRIAPKTVEHDSKNNTVASGFVFNYTPPFTDLALAIEQEPTPPTIIAGQSFSFRFRVENNGNSPGTPGKVTYQLQGSNGEVIRLSEEDPFPSMQKGQAPLIVTREFQLSETFPKGDYQLIASLELDDSRLEKTMDNNSIVFKTRLTIIPSLIDLALVLEIEDREQALKPGETITVKSRLSNTGSKDAKDIAVAYTLKNRSGKTVKIPQIDRIENLTAGSKKELETVIRVPQELTEGLYQIAAQATPKDTDFEENTRNNGDQSPYVFSYIQPRPVTEPVQQGAEAAQPTLEEPREDKPTNWLMHASAISLTLASAWQVQSENEKYQDAKDRESELQSQYSTSQTDAQVSLINAELENNRSQMKLYTQNANLWTALALVGVGWEVYNIFFWTPDGTPVTRANDVSTTTESGPIIADKWMHASAISVALLSYWQSQNELRQYDDLSNENDDLKAQYQSTTSESEIANIQSKIASNRTEMSSHIANANIFDGVTLIALGFESYLLWQNFTDKDVESANYRFPDATGFQLKPYVAYREVGLNLKYTW